MQFKITSANQRIEPDLMGHAPRFPGHVSGYGFDMKGTADLSGPLCCCETQPLARTGFSGWRNVQADMVSFLKGSKQKLTIYMIDFDATPNNLGDYILLNAWAKKDRFPFIDIQFISGDELKKCIAEPNTTAYFLSYDPAFIPDTLPETIRPLAPAYLQQLLNDKAMQRVFLDQTSALNPDWGLFQLDRSSVGIERLAKDIFDRFKETTHPGLVFKDLNLNLGKGVAILKEYDSPEKIAEFLHTIVDKNPAFGLFSAEFIVEAYVPSQENGIEYKDRSFVVVETDRSSKTTQTQVVLCRYYDSDSTAKGGRLANIHSSLEQETVQLHGIDQHAHANPYLKFFERMDQFDLTQYTLYCLSSDRPEHLIYLSRLLTQQTHLINEIDPKHLVVLIERLDNLASLSSENRSLQSLLSYLVGNQPIASDPTFESLIAYKYKAQQQAIPCRIYGKDLPDKQTPYLPHNLPVVTPQDITRLPTTCHQVVGQDATQSTLLKDCLVMFFRHHLLTQKELSKQQQSWLKAFLAPTKTASGHSLKAFMDDVMYEVDMYAQNLRFRGIIPESRLKKDPFKAFNKQEKIFRETLKTLKALY